MNEWQTSLRGHFQTDLVYLAVSSPLLSWTSFFEDRDPAGPLTSYSLTTSYVIFPPFQGECIIELDRVIDQRQTIKSIRYFSKSHLPNDPAMRFTALFEVKSKWEAQEIRPFLRDLVLDDKKLDILLLKHARSVKQPGGGVIYSSRIISKK